MSSTLPSIAIAVAIALVVGPLLGRLAVQRFSGLGLVTALTELRGAFLPFFLVPALVQAAGMDAAYAIALVVGGAQAIAVARWTTRRSGEWSQALVGGLALGRSRAALVSAITRSRGAVLATLGTTTVQVILLEVVLTGLEIPGSVPRDSWGASLWAKTPASQALVLAVGVALVLGTEVASSFLLRRGSRMSLRRGRKGRGQPEPR